MTPKPSAWGQYQHDMPQKRLTEALGGVVEDCVNSVGVDLNTASPSLLEKVAGISAAVSKNIVTYRGGKRRVPLPGRIEKSTQAGAVK